MFRLPRGGAASIRNGPGFRYSAIGIVNDWRCSVLQSFTPAHVHHRSVPPPRPFSFPTVSDSDRMAVTAAQMPFNS